MSFGIALSGLDAAQSDLNVTANNIANCGHHRLQVVELRVRGAVRRLAGRACSNTQIGNGVQLQQVRAAILAGRHRDHRQ